MASTVDSLQIAYEQTPRYEYAPIVSPYLISTAVRYSAIQSGRITPAPQFLSRADEVRGIEGSVPELLDGYQPAGDITIRAYVNDLIFLLGLSGYVATVTAGAATLDQWTITTTGIPTGGSFTATLTQASVAGSPFTTPAIPFNATAAQVQQILQAALQGTGVLVTATGGPLPTGVVVTFTGAGAGLAWTVALGTNSLTGGTTPAPAFAHTTTGAAGGGTQLPDGSYAPAGTNVWTFNKRTGLLAKTAQITTVYADEAVWLQGQGYAVSALSGDQSGALSATLMGLVLKRLSVDPNISPSYDTQAIPHLREGDIQVSWLGGSGLTSGFTWQVANPLARVRTLGIQSYYPDQMEQGGGRVAVTGTIAKQVLAGADIDAVLAGVTFSALGAWRSPKMIGATNFPYALFLRMPSAQIIGGDPDPLTNVRRFGGSYQWFAAWDEATGMDAQFTLVSNLAATGVASVGVGL